MAARHVALALEEAHGLGISHRDVKPGNVFLVDGPGGVVAKLVDFGIARDTSEPRADLTRAGALMGTPPYMSPEQVRGTEGACGRCDLWSLAVVAYCCLTGKLPFEGDCYGATCIAIHAGRFDPPSAVRPALTPRVDAFFARALNPTLERRYDGARELSDAFREATGSDANPADPCDGAKPAPAAPEELDALLRDTTVLELDGRDGDALHRGATEENLPIDLGRPRSFIRPAQASAGGRAARGRIGRREGPRRCCRVRLTSAPRPSAPWAQTCTRSASRVPRAVTRGWHTRCVDEGRRRGGRHDERRVPVKKEPNRAHRGSRSRRYERTPAAHREGADARGRRGRGARGARRPRRDAERAPVRADPVALAR